MSLDIFIPAYNEEKKVEMTVKKLFSELKKIKEDYVVYIVDDNSKDKTVSKLKKMQKNHSFRIIPCTVGPSRRENLAKVMANSKAEHVMFMDFDLATDIKHLSEMVAYLKDYDVVIGSRYKKGSKTKREPHRLIISKIYNAFMRLYFGSRLSDHQCGFKGFRTKKFKKIYREMGFDHSFKRGWFWDVECMVRTQKRNYSLKEIPVSWFPGDDSTFSIKQEIKMISTVLKLRFNL